MTTRVQVHMAHVSRAIAKRDVAEADYYLRFSGCTLVESACFLLESGFELRDLPVRSLLALDRAKRAAA